MHGVKKDIKGNQKSFYKHINNKSKKKKGWYAIKQGRKEIEKWY